jgi:hypothetical protein
MVSSKQLIQSKAISPETITSEILPKKKGKNHFRQVMEFNMTRAEAALARKILHAHECCWIPIHGYGSIL